MLSLESNLIPTFETECPQTSQSAVRQPSYLPIRNMFIITELLLTKFLDPMNSEVDPFGYPECPVEAKGLVVTPKYAKQLLLVKCCDTPLGIRASLHTHKHTEDRRKDRQM